MIKNAAVNSKLLDEMGWGSAVMNSKLLAETGWSRPSGALGKPGFGLLGRRSAVMHDLKIIPCAASRVPDESGFGSTG